MGPLLSLGVSSSTSPTGVFGVRGLWPLRLLVRDALRSPSAAPQAASASADMSVLAAACSTLAPNSRRSEHSDIRASSASPTSGPPCSTLSRAVIWNHPSLVETEQRRF